MRIRERYELAAELAEQYRMAGRKGRGKILDSFCLATGYGRKYAIEMLRGRQRVRQPVRRPRARRYDGQSFRNSLALIWEASGYICVERLKPFLIELARLLEFHHQLRLDPSTRTLLNEISVSTLRRRLRSMRPEAVWNPRLLRRPSRLRGLVPVVLNSLRAFDTPGHLEIDLVSHSGRCATGEWIYTLVATDLCTGWVEMEPVNAHVEQKNGYLIRGLLADHRLDSVEQLEWLVDLYAMARPFTNCFQPVMKRIGRIHTGTTSRRLHDQARTPLQRLLDSGAARPKMIAELVHLYTTVSPLTLRRRIEEHLTRMPRALQLEPGRPPKEGVARAS